MAEYKSNSHRSKETEKQEERQKLEPIAKGKAKKKSEVKKFADTFIAEDITTFGVPLIFSPLCPI